MLNSKSVCIKSICIKTYPKRPENLWNLKNIAFIEFLEFFWTKYILFYQNWPNITQGMSQNAKIAFNFLLDFSNYMLQLSKNIKTDYLGQMFWELL